MSKSAALRRTKKVLLVVIALLVSAEALGLFMDAVFKWFTPDGPVLWA